MSITEFSCPACRVKLTFLKPFPPDKKLICPYCESRFSLPATMGGRPRILSRSASKGGKSPGVPFRTGSILLSAAATAPATVMLSRPHPAETIRTTNGSESLPPSSPSSSPPDLRKIYRRFALILIMTILLLSGGFGTALYLVMKNRQPLVPSAQVIAQQKQAEELRRAKEEELEKQRAEFRQLMIEAGTALADHRFDGAAKSYQAALQLFPDDVEAAKGVSAARTSLEERARAKKEEERRQAEFAALMDQGQEAMKRQEFAAAARAFDNALRLIPDHAAAAKGFQEATEAAEAERAAQKRLADYERHMTVARAAMVGQRYTEARNEFLAALQNKPEDPAAVDGHKQAEKRLNELQEEAQRQVDFNRFMDQGDRALRNRRYEEAERAYTKAVGLLPRNVDARNGLREAQKALEKMKQDFNRLMQQGDVAMQTLRFGDAVRAYSQAAKIFPDNENADHKLQAAQKALDDVGTAQASYTRLMLEAGSAMRLGRFTDAALLYSAALRFAPGDFDALAGLRSARAGVMFGPPLVPVFP